MFFLLVLWILMLAHVVQHDVPDKTMWVLILVLGGSVGAIVYYFIVYKKDHKKTA